jgi:hypothetical protein
LVIEIPIERGIRAMTRTKAVRIVGRRSVEELQAIVNDLQAKEFLFLEADIEMLKAAKFLNRESGAAK